MIRCKRVLGLINNSFNHFNFELFEYPGLLEVVLSIEAKNLSMKVSTIIHNARKLLSGHSTQHQGHRKIIRCKKVTGLINNSLIYFYFEIFEYLGLLEEVLSIEVENLSMQVSTVIHNDRKLLDQNCVEYLKCPMF
jgi:ABC-type histidine transport system ATPase subunit